MNKNTEKILKYMKEIPFKEIIIKDPNDLLGINPLVILCYTTKNGRLKSRSLRLIEAEECKKYLENNDPEVTKCWIKYYK